MLLVCSRLRFKVAVHNFKTSSAGARVAPCGCFSIFFLPNVHLGGKRAFVDKYGCISGYYQFLEVTSLKMNRAQLSSTAIRPVVSSASHLAAADAEEIDRVRVK